MSELQGQATSRCHLHDPVVSHCSSRCARSGWRDTWVSASSQLSTRSTIMSQGASARLDQGDAFQVPVDLGFD